MSSMLSCHQGPFIIQQQARISSRFPFISCVLTEVFLVQAESSCLRKGVGTSWSLSWSLSTQTTTWFYDFLFNRFKSRWVLGFLLRLHTMFFPGYLSSRLPLFALLVYTWVLPENCCSSMQAHLISLKMRSASSFDHRTLMWMSHECLH